jgi:hypothetical protein
MAPDELRVWLAKRFIPTVVEQYPPAAKFLLISLLVLSPLYIPIAVTIVAFVGKRRDSTHDMCRCPGVANGGAKGAETH